MTSKPCRHVAAIAVAVALGAIVSTAAQEQHPFEPTLHQPGKDVQWVPTPPALVEKMLDLARLTPKDRLVDLGSGDGVLVIAAARRGARACGIEYDPRPGGVFEAQGEGGRCQSRTKFVRGDIFKTDFSDATVVTTFLLPSMNLRLRADVPGDEAGHAHRRQHVRRSPTGSRTTASRSSRANAGARRMLWIVPAPRRRHLAHAEGRSGRSRRGSRS